MSGILKLNQDLFRDFRDELATTPGGEDEVQFIVLPCRTRPLYREFVTNLDAVLGIKCEKYPETWAWLFSFRWSSVDGVERSALYRLDKLLDQWKALHDPGCDYRYYAERREALEDWAQEHNRPIWEL